MKIANNEPLFFLSALAILFLASSALLFYIFESNRITEEKHKYLNSIAKVKIDQILQWKADRLAEADFFSTTGKFIKYTVSLYDSLHHQEADNYFNEALEPFRLTNYLEDAFITDNNGNIVYTLDTTYKELDSIAQKFASIAIKKDTLIFSDFFFDKTRNGIYLNIVAPIKDNNGTILGTFIQLVNPEKSYLKHILNWSASESTAELLVYRKEDDHLLFFKKLKTKDKSKEFTTINLIQSEIVSVKAVLGETGIIQGLDYKGDKVVASVSKIPDLNWYIVAKMNKSEIYSEIWYRTGITFLIILLGIFSIVTGALFIYNNRKSKTYKELYIKEKELSEQQEKFRTTLYSIGDAVITTDANGFIKNMNPIAEQLTGWFESEGKDKKLENVFIIENEDTGLIVNNPVDKVLKEGSIVGLSNHTMLISKNGSKVPIADSASPIIDETKNIIGVVLVFRDQTEERDKERALKETNDKFIKIFNSSSESISLTQMSTGLIVEINDGFEKMFGYKRDEVIGKSTLELGIWQNISDRENVIGLLKSNGFVKNYEANGVGKDGKIVAGLISGEFIKIKNEPYLLLTIRDISDRKTFEESLKVSEEKFRGLIEFAPDAFFQGNQYGDLIFVNNKAVELTGYTSDELLTMNIKDLFVKEILDKKPLRYDLLNIGQTIKSERIIRKKDGSLLNIEMTSKKMPDGSYQSFFRDITERVLAQKQLIIQEEKFRKAFEISPDSININRLSDGLFISVNEGFCRITGYSKEETIGKSSIEINIWDSEEEREKLIRGLKSDGIVTNLEAKFKMKNGEKRYGLMSASIIELEGVKHILSITRDITDRILYEQNLIKTKTHYQKIIENAPDGIVLLTAEGVIKYVSPSAKKIFGYQPSERIETSPIELTHPDDEDNVVSALKNLISDPWFIPTIQYRFKHKNGNWVWIESTFTNLLNEPSVEAIVINFRDITEKKNAEIELLKKYELEEQISKIAQTAPGALCSYKLHTDGKVTMPYVSENWIKIFGFRQEEVAEDGSIIFDKILKEDSKRIIKEIEYSAKTLTDWRSEFRLINNDNSFAWIEGHSTPIKLGDGSIIWHGFITDITERKNLEIRLKTLFQGIEQSPATVLITDTNGNIEYVNLKFTETSGYTFEEVKGKNPRILNAGLKPKEDYALMWNNLLSGKEWQGEFYNKRKNGELYWESATISPIKNENNEIIKFIAIKEDITERKRLTKELVVAKEKAEEMNRVKSFFYANMSHELRTPFVGIVGYSELLVDALKDRPEEKEFAEQILNSSKRLTETLNKILNVTRLEFDKTELNLETININSFIGQIAALFSKLALSNNTTVLTEIDSENINIKSDKKMLEDILNNLVNNAIKFTKNGTITISAHKSKIDGQNLLVLKVADTGVGIPKDKQDIVWLEFRQASEGLNRSFEGTGLGLTITKKYVELLGGTISLQSEEGKGTTFTIELPVKSFNEKNDNSAAAEQKSEFPLQEKSDTANKPNILYVEDDVVALSFINIILRNHYNVQTAFSAQAALEIVNNKTFDALLLDINLGKGMDGVELMQKIRQIKGFEKLPIVAVTAYAAESDKVEFISKGFTHYLSKPFSSQELKDLLSKIFK